MSNDFLLFEHIADICIANCYRLQVYNLVFHNQDCTLNMEGIEMSRSLREEVRQKNISIENEETKSTGHRVNLESMELVETMKSMRMELQSCKVDNERMLRAQV